MVCSKVNFIFTHSVVINLSVIFKLLFPHFTHILLITVDWLVPFHLYRTVTKTGKQKRLQDLFNNFTYSSS